MTPSESVQIIARGPMYVSASVWKPTPCYGPEQQFTRAAVIRPWGSGVRKYSSTSPAAVDIERVNARGGVGLCLDSSMVSSPGLWCTLRCGVGIARCGRRG